MGQQRATTPIGTSPLGGGGWEGDSLSLPPGCLNRQKSATLATDATSVRDGMQNIRTLDGWSSPIVESVTHTTFTEDGSVQFRPDGCWDFAVLKSAQGTLVLRTGLTTSAVTHHASAGDEILSITF